MTCVEGMDDKNIDLKELLKTLKTDCACGGTTKDSRIELQGDHKEKVKKMLMKIGFSNDLIELR
jgi:translation initiation factor 1